MTIFARAPSALAITPYDRAHFFTYARLIDDCAAEIAWQSSAETILCLNIANDEKAAKACWISHLARAQWLIVDGLALLADPSSRSTLH